MFFPTVAVAAFAGASLVGAAPIINARKAAPTGWAHNVLEDYNDYHVRYIALECYKQHNTSFFDDCCHPLRASETLADHRQEYCTPNATALESASARVQKAAATATISGDSVPSAAPSDDTAQQYVSEAFATTTSPVWQEAAAQPTDNASTEDAPAPSSSSSSSSSSSDEPAPTPTPEPTPEAPTTEEKPTSTSTKDAEPTDSNNGNNNNGGSQSSGQTYSGEGTWYMQSEGADPSGLGSCGYKNSDSDYIAAISTVGSNWGNSKCGEMITVKNNANGKTVQVQIVDNCPTCASADSLDLSKPAFAAIADVGTGVIDITWWFNN